MYIKQGANGPGPPDLHNATRKFQTNKKSMASIENHKFYRQPALFDGASMEAIIT
jgi:hypothetical protein